MRYWWVNQNQTHREEHAGGYLWSPVRKSDGARNPFYDFMREVAPGDIVFCFFDQRISAIGIATSYCFDAPKPTEFGTKGSYWEAFGHRIAVRYVPCPRPFRPKDYIDHLRPFIPDRYGPLRKDTGDGKQMVYLTTVGEDLAQQLLTVARFDHAFLMAARGGALSSLGDYDGTGVTRQIEDELERAVRADESLEVTVRKSVVDARRGQGEFRRSVLELERVCRVTGVQDPVHLLASHIKPWRSCGDAMERLDGNNGLALAPHVDHLFDKGFVSFDGGGRILVSPLLDASILHAFHIDPASKVGTFRDEQLAYLAYHQGHVLRRAV